MLHILSLGVLFCFLVSGVDGNYPIKGDDILETSMAPKEVIGDRSLLELYQARCGLKLSYYTFRHRIAGGSFATANMITLYLYGASAILFYLVLSSYFSSTVAWMGSMLYMAHAAKYEVLIWFAASMYVPVVILLMFTFWVVGKSWSPILKGLLIGVTGWASMLFYEVFATVPPVYFIVMVGGDYVKNKRFSSRVIIGSLIPICFVAVHIVVLSTAKNPIWNRSMVLPEYVTTPITVKVLLGLFNSVEATFGVKHIELLIDGVLAFFCYYIFSRPTLLLMFLIVVAQGVAMLTKFRPEVRKSSCR